MRLRTLVWPALAIAALVNLASPVHARTLNPAKAADAVTIARKIACSTVDGEPSVFWWEGSAFSRRMGERDKLLFDVEGMNIRTCIADTHPERGKGYRLVSRELLFYKDPATGDVLHSWDNPWTGESVQVMHVANDPVNFGSYEKGRDGKPARWSGAITEGRWRQRSTVPLFYSNPLAGEYQDEVGGIYHATEMFNFLGDSKELLSSRTTSAGSHIGWVRMSDWLPWMKMAGRDGAIYMHTAGLKLSGYKALPEKLRQVIKQHYPAYQTPPPADDSRENVTSWMYYQRVTEGKEPWPEPGKK